MPTVKANGLDIEYEVRGEGPPVLLIMGLAAQMTLWPEAFCQLLADRGFQVIRFDNRDIGLSQKMDSAGFPDLPGIFQALAAGQPPKAAYDLSDMARDAVGVLDGLGIEKAHIVGASMGGMIGQIVAADFPERVLSFASIMSTTGAPDLPPATPEAAALLSTPAPDPRSDFAAYMAHMLRGSRVIGSPGYPFDEAAIRARIEGDYRRCYHPIGFLRQYAAVLASPQRRQKIGTIKAPTVVIHGAEDALVPLEHGRDTARHIPGAELVVIPGMGHDFPAGVHAPIIDAVVKNIERAG